MSVGFVTAVTPQPRPARQTTHRVLAVRELSTSAYVLRFERNGLEFSPGQYVNVGITGRHDVREYSVYSGVGDDAMEILVKEVEGGLVSQRLRRCRPGDELTVEGPFGFFTIAPQALRERHFVLIGTGTGISPFHCFAASYPDLDYRVLHGVRAPAECYEHGVFGGRVTSCVSRGRGGDFQGRVTDYLRSHPVEPGWLCYLCGNCDMIYEAFDILRSQGVPSRQLFAEVYF
jgi:ferredoxin--NADP+ reductase/benzoate/toluate 1,2-dioxygenase reductase subunit